MVYSYFVSDIEKMEIKVPVLPDVKDQLDLVAICDASGEIQERYAYSAFGRVTVLDQDFVERIVNESDFAWNWLFHGEFSDEVTSWYNYGYRYYMADLGRWISRDSIGERGGVNLYGMVKNKAINFKDIIGLAFAQPSCEISAKVNSAICQYECICPPGFRHSLAGGYSGHFFYTDKCCNPGGPAPCYNDDPDEVEVPIGIPHETRDNAAEEDNSLWAVFAAAAITGGTYALVGGQLGPQAATPEEIITVPLTAVAAGIVAVSSALFND